MAPVFVMLREHAQMWLILDALERDLECGIASDAALARCNQLTIQLQQHNLKEERILYPQADDVLTGSASEQLRTFLDSGELPEGWVCEQARA